MLRPWMQRRNGRPGETPGARDRCRGRAPRPRGEERSTGSGLPPVRGDRAGLRPRVPQGECLAGTHRLQAAQALLRLAGPERRLCALCPEPRRGASGAWQHAGPRGTDVPPEPGSGFRGAPIECAAPACPGVGCLAQRGVPSPTRQGHRAPTGGGRPRDPSRLPTRRRARRPHGRPWTAYRSAREHAQGDPPQGRAQGSEDRAFPRTRAAAASRARGGPIARRSAARCAVHPGTDDAVRGSTHDPRWATPDRRRGIRATGGPEPVLPGMGSARRAPYPLTAKARTGNVAIPRMRGGTA
jgi:hypothetical protein